MKQTLIATVTLGLVVGAIACDVYAQTVGPDQQVVTGIGNDSCASYVLALAEDRPTAAIEMEGKTYYTAANAYTQWINGFVTATNLASKPGRGQILVDVNGIALWIKNFCDANPSERIVNGVVAFVRAHKAKIK